MVQEPIVGFLQGLDLLVEMFFNLGACVQTHRNGFLFTKNWSKWFFCSIWETRFIDKIGKVIFLFKVISVVYKIIKQKAPEAVKFVCRIPSCTFVYHLTKNWGSI